MSVIFDQLDNIQPLRIKFTQAIKLGASLYYIDNQNLMRVITSDNSFTEQEAMDVLPNVTQICTDGKCLFCLQSNGDLYQIEQQPKLLVQNKNYMSITPTTAIDHSGKGFFWKTNKAIYSHCKHISAYKDKLTLITSNQLQQSLVGGKILNIENDAQVPIQQLNGLGVNGYFKKCILFHFGGIAITENGDAYCYTSKMIKLKISNVEDISASNRFIFAVQGKCLLQWNVEDFQNHQFYINQNLFKKMNYGHEISINCKRKEFADIRLIFADQYSSLCCAQLRSVSKANQNDQSVSVLERTFCRSSVSNLKQQLFDQWDPPQKKRAQEQRQSRQTRGERTERSDASNKMTDRYERKEDFSQPSQESRFKQQGVLDMLFERNNAKEQQSEILQQPSLQLDTNFKITMKPKQEVTPLEITKMSYLDKQQSEKTQQLPIQQIISQDSFQEEQKSEKLIQPTKLLEQQKKQFEQLNIQNSEQTIEQQSTDQFDNSKEQEEPIRQEKVVKQPIVEKQQQIISQKLQSIREIYDQPRFKTQNNSLYTLDEESSVEQSMCQDDDDRGTYEIKKKVYSVNEMFENRIESKPVSKKIDIIKQRISQNDIVSPTLSIESPLVQQVQQQISIPELQFPSMSSNLSNLLNKIQLKPEKSIDAILVEQTKKKEEPEVQSVNDNTSSFQKIEEPQVKSKQIKSFLKIDQIQTSKQKRTVEVMDQQSVIDYQNNSDFIDQQHDSFMQILQSDKKIENPKIQNIMQIFDQISVPVKTKTPSKLNLFKKIEQENQKVAEQISNGQLDENLIEVSKVKQDSKQILTEKYNELPLKMEKLASPLKQSKEHKTLITFSEDMSQDQLVEERIMQVMKVDENRPTVQRAKSPQKENYSPEKLIKLQPIEIDEQKVLKQVNKSSDVKQPFEQQKQALSRSKIQPINCCSSRPEKNFTPLRSRRNSTARGSSIDTNRFKQLQIETQVAVPEIANQTPQINTFEVLDLSTAMYHVNQTEMEETTRRTPVAQVLDVMSQQQKSQKKEPALIRVSSTAQIPPSIRTTSIGARRTEVSPIKALANIGGARINRVSEDTTLRMKRRQQDIILRKLFFRLDIHIKLAKLEFMFNMKQRAGK